MNLRIGLRGIRAELKEPIAWRRTAAQTFQSLRCGGSILTPITDETRRRIERELDLEARFKHAQIIASAIEGDRGDPAKGDAF